MNMPSHAGFRSGLVTSAALLALLGGCAGGAPAKAPPDGGGTGGAGGATNFTTTDLATWLQMTTTGSGSGSANTLDFEDVPEGRLTGSEWSGAAGRPQLVSVAGEGLYIGVAAKTFAQIASAPSGTNMLLPIEVNSQDEPSEGIIRFDFDAPVRAFAATFVDVEADYASTGFGLSNDATPRFAFNQAPSGADGAFAFLGVVLSDPVASIAIHFATGPSIDGVLVDDVRYVMAR